MIAEQLYSIFTLHPRVETDSRRVEEGCLFFALKGEHFNGNRFAAEALEKGAAYAVVDEEEYAQSSGTLLVDDVLSTLQELALLHRKKLGLPVLAITGSNGKTTTKELIAAVLSQKYRLVCTQGNLNNHIGVPLTLLQMNKDIEMAVVEMGANHPGEIKALCALADPDYGIITNIGRAHLEGFGSFEAIKSTKAELYDHLRRKKGTVFYNVDNPVLVQLAESVPDKVRFGAKEGIVTGHIAGASPYVHLEVCFSGEMRNIETRLIGRYNVENILAAACIGHYFQVALPKIQSAIAGYTPVNNRSQLIEKNGLKIIMDAYNANPTSMQASIDSFVSEFSSPRFLILGDMLELGRESLKEHQKILDQIKKHPFERVFLIGPLFSRAARNSSFLTFPDSGALGEYLTHHPVTRGAVLLKASRGIQVEKVISFL